jgi:hypothetical protein
LERLSGKSRVPAGEDSEAAADSTVDSTVGTAADRAEDTAAGLLNPFKSVDKRLRGIGSNRLNDQNERGLNPGDLTPGFLFRNSTVDRLSTLI